MNYRDRINDEANKRLVALQSPAVQQAYTGLEKTAMNVAQMARWALDDEDKSHDYYLTRAIEYAHELIDAAYEFRDAIRKDGIYHAPEEPSDAS